MKPRSGLSDTDPKVERLIIERTRLIPDWVKFRQVASLTSTCRRLALIGVRDRHPQARDGELSRGLAALVLDRETAARVYDQRPDADGDHPDIDLIDVLLSVVGALENLNVRYCVAGSLASCLYGRPRSTQDADLIAAIAPEQASPLTSELQPAFYADEQDIVRAVRAKGVF